MHPITRRSFVKVGSALLAFVPAARALAAAPTDQAAIRIDQPKGGRVEKYVGGYVTGFTSNQLNLHGHDGDYLLRLATNTEVWKGRYDRGAVIEIGDRIEAWGKREPGGYFDVERMWVNIVNLIGPVTSVRQGSDTIRLIHKDRHRGNMAVLIDQSTLVPAGRRWQTFSSGKLQLPPRGNVQIIGLRLRDGTVHATRVLL